MLTIKFTTAELAEMEENDEIELGGRMARVNHRRY